MLLFEQNIVKYCYSSHFTLRWLMALGASPSEPSNNKMFLKKTFHTPNRLRKEPISHKSDNV